jgi:hypothetical protein
VSAPYIGGAMGKNRKIQREQARRDEYEPQEVEKSDAQVFFENFFKSDIYHRYFNKEDENYLEASDRIISNPELLKLYMEKHNGR